MSADNWNICPNPKCDQPLDEYGERRTVREDYEQGLSEQSIEDGTPEYFVNYSAVCACGFHFEYKYTQEVKV